MASDIKIYMGERAIVLTDKGKKSLQKGDGFSYKLEETEGLLPLIAFFERTPEMAILDIICNPRKAITQLKNSYRYVKAAGGLVINNDDKLLMMYRRGKWDLPKGKVEPGEKIKKAALREVTEECGISEGLTAKSELCETWHTYQEKGNKVLKRTTWYRMKYEGSEQPIPETGEDIEQVCWVSRDEIKPLIAGSYASIRPVLKEF